MTEPTPCHHGDTMGVHGRVICVWCKAVIREMSPEERAADPTWRTVIDPKAMESVRKLFGPKR